MRPRPVWMAVMAVTAAAWTARAGATPPAAAPAPTAAAPAPAAPTDVAADPATREAAALEEANAPADAEAEALAAPPASFAVGSFGPRYTIERIVVRGNGKTETALILAELDLHPGDVVAASDKRVEAARFRLLALGFFLEARLSLERGAQRGGAVLVVQVEERGTIVVNAVHLGVSSATQLWGGLELTENNLLGRGFGLGGGFVTSTQPDVVNAEPGLALRIRASVPPLGGTGVSINASGLYSSGSEFFRAAGPDSSGAPADFVAVRTRRVGGVLGAGRALARATRLYLDLREEGVSAELPELRTRDVGGGVTVPIDFQILPGFSRVGSLTATIDFDTRSDPLLPRSGTHLALSTEAAGNVLGSSYRFVKLTLQGSAHRRAWRSHVMALYLYAGALFGDAPYFDRFFIGDLNLFLPPRALGLNFSTRPALGASIDGHRYDNFAARVLGEYAVPLWRKRRFVYGGDAFIAFGVYGLASNGNFRDPTRTGLAAWPIGLTGDLGVRLDTYIGVFTLSLGNALGRIPL